MGVCTESELQAFRARTGIACASCGERFPDVGKTGEAPGKPRVCEACKAEGAEP